MGVTMKNQTKIEKVVPTLIKAADDIRILSKHTDDLSVDVFRDYVRASINDLKSVIAHLENAHEQLSREVVRS